MPGFIDFKQLAENIDIEQVAHKLGLMLKRGKDLRAKCPACNSNDERALQIIPETNSFRCYAAELSGDCIALYGHIKGLGMYAAAKQLQELFCNSPTGERKNTAPQKPGVSPSPRASAAAPVKSRPEPFDPQAFAQKLDYSSEVEALGFSQEDAERFQIGFHRGQVYFPIRDPNGSIAGFLGYKDGALKLPPKWLPEDTKVVAFKRPA